MVITVSDLRIRKQRLWDSLMEMAAIGETPNGGVTRLALSDEDKAGRDLFVRWAKEEGCSVRIDAMGNIFARRKGLEDHLPPVITGSHADSQPMGGRFDGIYGVLAGLEVVRTLNDGGVHTRIPIEVVNWTNEEGSRFAPAMIGSGVACGVFELEYGLTRADAQGNTIGQELKRIGYGDTAMQEPLNVHACFELHIEQGPILESAGTTIGVVSGGQGQYWYNGHILGQAAHAGTTPMDRRRDALLGLAELTLLVNRIGTAFAPYGRATIGNIELTPNSRNVVPGRVDFTVEFRHPEEDILARMDRLLRAGLVEIGATKSLETGLERIFNYAPVAFDPLCVDIVRSVAGQLRYLHQDMISGAGHDALYVSRIAPTAMIFVPCIDGLSHNEAEDITPQWAEAGANVLLHSIMTAAS
jgi:N-carbamoyl-L-amino-acid hydrolase